jgi:hypothetical protein
MIASVATEHDIPLLHNDRDFDAIASLGDLKVVKTRERPTSRGVPLPVISTLNLKMNTDLAEELEAGPTSSGGCGRPPQAGP